MTTSIIVSMCNKKSSVIETIDGLLFPSLLNNASSDKEVVILDDDSPLEKETQRLVDKYLLELRSNFGNVIFERNKENYGFGKSYNKGVERAGGGSLVIANDDLYFPEGTVDDLVSVLGQDPAYGVVGPITNERWTWTKQYCKQGPKIKDYSSEELEKIEDFAKLVKRLMKGKTMRTDLVSGFCFATRRNIVEELGLFDERFKYGFFEDTDFVRRVGQEYEIVIAALVYVNHGGIKRASGSVLQHPWKAAKAFLVKGYKYGRKWKDVRGIVGYAWRGIYGGVTGKGTVSMDVGKTLKED